MSLLGGILGFAVGIGLLCIYRKVLLLCWARNLEGVASFAILPLFWLLLYILTYRLLRPWSEEHEVFLKEAFGWLGATSLGATISALVRDPYPFRPEYWIILICIEIFLVPSGAFYGSRLSSILEKRKRYKMLLFELQKCEEKILALEKKKERLEKKKGRWESTLQRKGSMEEEIRRLVSVDPKVLELKAREIETHIKKLRKEDIEKRIKVIDNKLRDLKREKQQAEEKVNALKEERQNIQTQLKRERNRLAKLKQNEPRVVEIQIRHLKDQWEGLSLAELETIKVKGVIPKLYLQVLILEAKERELKREIQGLNRELADPLPDAAVRLEKTLLEKELVSRNLPPDLSSLGPVKAELRKLYAKRRRLCAQMRKLEVQ